MGPTGWLDGVDVAMTVCDADGVIVAMNARSARTFAEDGGYDLIGRPLADCHPEPARTKFLDLLRDRRRNVYTIEKAGKRKLIYQEPVWRDGTFAGFVELSMEIPDRMPHFVREPRPA